MFLLAFFNYYLLLLRKKKLLLLKTLLWLVLFIPRAIRTYETKPQASRSSKITTTF